MDVLKIVLILGAIVLVSYYLHKYNDYIQYSFNRSIFNFGTTFALLIAEAMILYPIFEDFQMKTGNIIALFVIAAIILIACAGYNINTFGTKHGAFITAIQFVIALVVLAIILLLMVMMSDSKKKKRR